MLHFNKSLGLFKTGPFIIRLKTDFFFIFFFRSASSHGFFVLQFTTKAFLLSVMLAIQNEVTVCAITPFRTKRGSKTGFETFSH